MKTTRLKAAGIHLAISATVAVLAIFLIFFVWYPSPLFSAIGGQRFVALIVGVDLCLGPLLTLVVYDPTKARWKLVMNLAVIGACQITALVYGMQVAYESRPVYVAYAKERFAVVTADFSYALRHPHFPVAEKYQTMSSWGFEWVGVRPPTDRKSLEHLELLRSYGGMADIHAHPQFYVDIAEVRPLIRVAAKPVAKLKELNPDATAAIDKAVAKTGKNPDSVGYLPLNTPQRQMSVLVDKESGEPLRLVDFTPE